MTFNVRSFPPRFAQTLASYYPNHLFIVLGSDTRLVDDAGKQVEDVSPAVAATFVHEYMHYLHNVSTVAGFKSFHMWQQLVAYFSGTLDSSGTSRGSESLTEEQVSNIAGLLKLEEIIEGDFEPKLSQPVDEVTSFAVSQLVDAVESILLEGKQMQVPTATAVCETTFADGFTEKCRFSIGTIAIEEGIAYELDRMIAGVGSCKSASDDAPLFPYLVLREVGLHLCQSSIERIALVSCAVLSLQTAAPPKLLIELLRQYSSLRAGGLTIEKALDQLVQDTKRHREGLISVARQDLQGLRKIHQRRGVSEEAMRQVSDIFDRLLQRRLVDPFFELRPFAKNAADPVAITELMSSVLPCDVVQERDGCDDDVERDLLLAFGNRSSSNTGSADQDVQPLRVMQCMIHYVQSHIGHSELLASIKDDDNACPFYTSCPLKLRADHPDTCRTEPWKIFEKNRTETCWYGAATASTLGEVALHQAKPST